MAFVLANVVNVAVLVVQLPRRISPRAREVTQSAHLGAARRRARGDNNQVLALAEALGLPFETRTLRLSTRCRR